MHYLPTHHETNDPDFQQLSDFVVAEMRRLSVPGVAIGLMLFTTSALYLLCIRLLISGRGMRQ